MAEIRTIALEAVRQRGQADAQTLAERAVAGEADGTELTASQDIIPTWRQRDFSAVPIGTPYQWKGLVYKLWQQHDATVQPDWSPDLAVSLWDLCHTTDPRLAAPYAQAQGSRGMHRERPCVAVHPVQHGLSTLSAARLLDRPGDRGGGTGLMEWTTLAVAGMSLIGTLAGTFGGILVANKLTTYRIEQLERKVSEHNKVVERTYKLEGRMTEAEHDIRDLKGAA